MNTDPHPSKTPDDEVWDNETREMARLRETFIGPYRIEHKLGEGGMGVVYKSFDEKLKRFVAIKVLKDRLAHNERHLKRLSREAVAVASLSHPAIVQIHDFEDGSESSGGRPYLVMEYIEGESAESHLRRGPFAIDEALSLILGAARGLRAALEKGIVHRDIKPSNLLITTSGEPKIVDFGLAKALESDVNLTDDNVILGSPYYISPEQGLGNAVDHRSDIYSLGATFYHLITGRVVFQGENQQALIYKHVNDAPDPPEKHRPDLSPALSQVMGRMLAKDPAERYETYDSLIRDLERVASGESPGEKALSSGKNTYRRRHASIPWRSRAAFWFIAGLAVWSAVAILLVMVVSLINGGATGKASDVFEQFRLSADGDVDVLEFAFERLAGEVNAARTLEEIFWFSTDSRPRLSSTNGLELRKHEAPLVLRKPLERLDTLELRGLRLGGVVDLEIAIRHAGGGLIRKLSFAVSGHRSEKANAEPIRAVRRENDIVLDPRPATLESFSRGTDYDVIIRLRPLGTNRTALSLEIRASQSGQAALYAPEEHQLDGTDWRSGVLEIRTAQPMEASSWQSIKSMKLVGKLGKKALIDYYATPRH